MIEKNFDISFISSLALREKQIQQSYRPVIAVHKWFARRPGTLFRGLLLSEFSKLRLPDAFYTSNSFPGLHVADPFMGGGTPILEANRVGCDVTGFDINPMSWWIVKQEIEHLNLRDYTKAADLLRSALEREIGHLYRTRCEFCGSENVPVKYFLWIKTQKCGNCGEEADLFPGYLLSADARHPQNVLICPSCGSLTETEDKNNPGQCRHCSSELLLKGPAGRNRFTCPSCGCHSRYPEAESGPPRHRLFAIEYYCRKCRPNHKGRFFKKPDTGDLAKTKEAEEIWRRMQAKFVPDDQIPTGDETNRLHRWGYRQYREMFNARQLAGLELSARLIAEIMDDRVRNALATNFSDLLRYQNMLCRYDTRALKSLDIFSVHGFPVGLIQCESNFLGIQEPGRSTCVGSGGWANIIKKYKKAKAYCGHPFEVRRNGRRKTIIPIDNEWIGDHLNASGSAPSRSVSISRQDAASSCLTENSLDAVFTDPPYFGNVQYAELMDFCYVWLRRLVGHAFPEFDAVSTRRMEELTGNADMGRDLGHFTEGLSAVFQRMSQALKPGSPFAFTYHHNQLSAYFPVAVAILDAGLTCSASFPCPAEMGASIHISGTGSSIIDTVFVCRSTGIMRRKWLADTPAGVAEIVKNDLALLEAGNVKPKPGDVRCVTFGHLIRLAIWSLRSCWDKSRPVGTRLGDVENWLCKFEEKSGTAAFIRTNKAETAKDLPLFAARETIAEEGVDYADISF